MPAVPAPAMRLDALDALRGAAMVWMAVFHFCYDLNHFGLLEPRQRFTSDPFWTVQRTCIVTLFVFCAGAGQALAAEAGQSARRFWQRWAQVAGCALLVTAGSWWMFPRSFIYFGVLHGMAVMLLIARPTRDLGRWLWPMGLAAIAMPHVLRHPWLDGLWIHWLGLASRRPYSEDFVPVLPWIGVLWCGMAAVGELRRSPRLAAALSRPLPRPGSALAALGRWPLTFYMLHQPVLIGLIMLSLGRMAP